MKIKKILSGIMLIMLLMVFVKIPSEATEDNTRTEVTLTPKLNKIEEGVEIPIEMQIKNENHKIYAIDVLVEYNDEVFYEFEPEDFETDMEMFIFEYEKEYKNLKIVFEEPIQEGVIATIKVTPKKTITSGTEDIETQLIKMYDMYLVAEDYSEEVIPELESSVLTLGEVENTIIEPEDPENPEEPENPEDKLYLSSEIYKIGDNDIKKYEEGDKYISRVEKETTKNEFINNLSTNGTIRILKEDGTELEEDGLVGTGMTIEVVKDEEKITMKIAVMGDLTGDGKVTATDLSTLNQTILKLVTLENEYHIAGDLDENDKITATDLSTENKMLLKLI